MAMLLLQAVPGCTPAASQCSFPTPSFSDLSALPCSQLYFVSNGVPCPAAWSISSLFWTSTTPGHWLCWKLISGTNTAPLMPTSATLKVRALECHFKTPFQCVMQALWNMFSAEESMLTRLYVIEWQLDPWDFAGALRAAGVSTDSEASTSAGPSVSEASITTAEAQSCIVCFEIVAPKKMSVMLPCEHITCDTCWKVRRHRAHNCHFE